MGASSAQSHLLWDLVEEGGSLTTPSERKAVGREETRLFALLMCWVWFVVVWGGVFWFFLFGRVFLFGWFFSVGWSCYF